MPDKCRPILDRIAELKSQRQLLQSELKSNPGMKEGLAKLIKELAIQIAQQEVLLKQCRADNPQPVLPDFSMESRLCLPDDKRRQLIEQLNEAFSGERGIAQSLCIGGTERTGVWIPERGSSEARDLGLESVNLLPDGGENVGFLVRRGLIQRRAREAWDAQPKVLNSDGDFDPDGRIILTNFSFRFESPNRVVTQIEGFRRGFFPFPDTDFTVTITDILTVVLQDEEDIGKLACSSSVDTEAEFDIFDFITSLLLGGPLLGAIRGLFQISADIFDGSLGPDHEDGGVGCGVLQLLPETIAIDDETSVEITYNRISVFPSGILALGFASIVSRTSDRLMVSTGLSGRAALVVESR